MANGKNAELAPRSAAKRQDILDTAAELFAERGFEKTSMQILAAEARASTSTIYTYFKDKTDLLNQVIAGRTQALLDQLAQALKGHRDPLEVLTIGAKTLNGALARDPLLSKILSYQTRVSDRRLRQRARHLHESIDKMGSALIRKVVEAGRLPCEDPEALNAVIQLYVRGWILAHSWGESVLPEERVTGALLDLIRAAARPVKSNRK